MPDRSSNTFRQNAMRSFASGVGAGTFVLITVLVFDHYQIGHGIRAIGSAIAGGCGGAFASFLWRRLVTGNDNQN